MAALSDRATASPVTLHVRLLSGIAEIAPEAWNALLPDSQPFLRHEFLAALERHGCVGEACGWLPRHLVLFRSGELVGAMPLYEKHNSWGEFVFDHAWADAYERSGLRYYPKLVSAVPFTPVTGRRLLADDEVRQAAMSALLDGALDMTRNLPASGLHCLFPGQAECAWLEERELLVRHDCQFHWHNRGYGSFGDFLDALSARKRKNIRRERRRVEQAGVRIRLLDGHCATAGEWEVFDRLYRSLYHRKWGAPALNAAFFREVARKLPEQTLLILAERGGRIIAGALFFRDDRTLYGRHWGCLEQVDCLHFEVCYYQGIEYCIRQGLERFEPGAQGEHKLARGFLPVLTRSAHWIAPQSPYRNAIARFVAQERAAVADYCAGANLHSPYKKK